MTKNRLITVECWLRVLGASELYRETEDDPMEYMKKLLELNKEDKSTN